MSPCPPLEELAALAPDGANANGELGSHLAHCVQCRSRLDQIRHDNRLLDELRGLDGSATPSDVAGPTVSFDSAAASQRSDAAAPFAASDDRSLLHDFGYEIGPELSRGGQGTVFSAVQRSTHRRVALKVLHPERTPTQRQRMRFEREVEVVARLRHPNIVTVYDSGALPDGRPFYAMELVEGQPLNGWISHLRSEASDSQAPWEPRTTEPMLRLFVKICDAVQYAHQRGVIHRDLKPANILIDREGQPRVLDFGLARLAQDESGAAGFTHTGDFVGTLAYAAPEQLRGDPHAIDVRTDVHALGVILYEMLTGRLPFATDGPLSGVISRIIDQEPPALARAGSRFPKDLSAVVQKSLSKEPDRRYATAGELGADLQRFLADEAVLARPTSVATHAARWVRRHRAIAAVIGVAAAMLIAVGITSFARIARERANALSNLDLARDKLRSSMMALEQVFETEKSLRNVLGTSKTRREMIDVALRFYEKLPRDAALLGLEELAGPQFGKLGQALYERGELESAKFSALSLSSARVAVAAQPASAQAQRELVVALHRCALMERDLDAGLKLLTNAAEISRRIDVVFPNTAEFRLLLADALLRLAEQDARMNRMVEFRAVADEALETAGRAAPHATGDAVRDVKICDLHFRAVNAAHFAHDQSGFAWASGQALTFAREMAVRWPSDPGVQCDSLRLINLCTEHLITWNDLDEADRLLVETRGRADNLVAAHPRDFKLRMALADVYALLATQASAAREFGSALQWYDRSNGFIVPMFELQPNDAELRTLYAITLQAIASVHDDTGDKQKAADAYAMSLSVSEPLFNEQVEHAPMRAYAWHYVGTAAAGHDPQRAAECFRRGLEDLRTLEQHRELLEPERQFRQMLTAAAAGVPSFPPASGGASP